jgi:hypothetical protein
MGSRNWQQIAKRRYYFHNSTSKKMRKFHKNKWGLVILFSALFIQSSFAQFTLTGQVRTRSEIRDGLANLAPLGSSYAAFTSQRTSLSFGYKWDRVLFGATLRDVRVWGQDASSISNADGNKMFLHEGWAEITLANSADTTIKFKPIQNLSLKIGRQELIYDDVRLIGNLDWLQQGRRFDMALLKAQHLGWSLDIGGSFNQNTDAFGTNGTYYTAGNIPAYAASTKGILTTVPANFIPTATKGGAPVLANGVSTNGQNQEYKSFQSAYLSHKFGQTKFSALFFKDDFSKYRADSIGNATNGYVYGRRYDQPETNSRMTYGAMLNGVLGNASGFGKISWQAWYYAQSGNDRDGNTISGAYHYGAFANYQKGQFSIGPGYEILSGNDGNTIIAGETHRFDPLYGTPHKHWGYMDYFFVGTGSPVGGLQDFYIKTKFANKNLVLSFEPHYFSLAEATPNKLSDAVKGSQIDSKLGVEYDFTATYTLNKFTTVEFGYSVLEGTNSLEYAKSATMDKTRKTGVWSYLMLNIRPDFFYSKPVAIKQ